MSLNKVSSLFTLTAAAMGAEQSIAEWKIDRTPFNWQKAKSKKAKKKIKQAKQSRKRNRK